MAKISGNIFRITDLAGFVASYLVQPNSPTSSTFTAATGCRVSLKHNLGDNTWGGLIPDVQTTPIKVGAGGAFSIDIGALNGVAGLDGQLIVEELIQTVDAPLIGKIEIWALVYRSAPFEMKSVKDAAQKIYYQKVDVPASAYVTQAQVNAAVAGARSSLPAGVDSISAIITSSALSVSGSGRGAKLTFKVKLSGSKSHDLGVLLSSSVDDFDIDLPGPDAIVTLCVNEDEIESQVRAAISTLVRSEVTPMLKDALVQAAAASSGLPVATVRNVIDTKTSISVSSVSYPKTGSVKMPITNTLIPTYSIKIQPSVGLPRALFG